MSSSSGDNTVGAILITAVLNFDIRTSFLVSTWVCHFLKSLSPLTRNYSNNTLATCDIPFYKGRYLLFCTCANYDTALVKSRSFLFKSLRKTACQNYQTLRIGFFYLVDKLSAFWVRLSGNSAGIYNTNLCISIILSDLIPLRQHCFLYIFCFILVYLAAECIEKGFHIWFPFSSQMFIMHNKSQ